MVIKDARKLNKLIKFHSSFPDRIVSREGSCLEFKESFNWRSKDEYGKVIASFANNKGGLLVFGIKDNPRSLIGLKNEKFESLDEAIISGYLNSIFSPEVLWEKFIYRIKNKKLGIIYIKGNSDKPVDCIKNDGILKEADIYYRYNGRSEKIKYPELIKIITNIKEQVSREWIGYIKKISKIGPQNAAILDVVKGQIKGAGGTLIIDNKLIPKINFIRQGEFNKKGAPALKLVGDVRGAPVIGYKTKKISEEEHFKYSFTDIYKKMEISSYILTCLFWKFPILKKDKKYCHYFAISPRFRPIKYSEETLLFLKKKLKTINIQKLREEYRKSIKKRRLK